MARADDVEREEAARGARDLRERRGGERLQRAEGDRGAEGEGERGGVEREEMRLGEREGDARAVGGDVEEVGGDGGLGVRGERFVLRRAREARLGELLEEEREAEGAVGVTRASRVDEGGRRGGGGGA